MATGTEGPWMSLTYGAYPQHIEQKAYEKELARLEALRDITITVVPCSTTTSETESAALDFEPFTFTINEEQSLGDLARMCKSELPDDESGLPYEFRADGGTVGYRISERSNGMVNALLRTGETELEVRVSVAPPPGYKKGKGKGLLGKLGLR